MFLKVSSVHSRYANNKIEDILFVSTPRFLLIDPILYVSVTHQNHGYRKGNLDDVGLVTTNFAP